MRTKATAGFIAAPVPKPYRQLLRNIQKTSQKHWSKPSVLQDGCPLFAQLALEIRCMIYEYVFTLDSEGYVQGWLAEDDTKLSGEVIPIFRPLKGHKNEQLCAVAWLQSCQTIYEEARPLWVMARVHYLFYPPRPALSFPLPTVARRYLKNKTHAQISDIKSLHLFVASNLLATSSCGANKVGGYRSETPMAEIALIRHGGEKEKPRLPLRPEFLTISIRHEDWCPRLGGREIHTMKYFLSNEYWCNFLDGVRIFTMELEVETRYKSCLDQAVADLSEFSFRIDDSSSLVMDGKVRELVWNSRPDEGTKTPWLASWLRETGRNEEEIMQVLRDEQEDSPVQPATTTSSTREQDRESGQRTVFLFRWRLQRTSNQTTSTTTTSDEELSTYTSTTTRNCICVEIYQ